MRKLDTTIGPRALVLAVVLAGVGAGAAGCGGWHGDGHGRGGRDGYGLFGGRGHGMAAICEARGRGDHLDRILGRAERHLDLSEAQEPAWDRLATEVRSVVGDACAAARPDEEPANALAAFARMERVAGASAAGLERLRPAIEAFYAELTPEQRRDVDRIFTRHRLG